MGESQAQCRTTSAGKIRFPAACPNHSAEGETRRIRDEWAFWPPTERLIKPGRKWNRSKSGALSATGGDGFCVSVLGWSPASNREAGGRGLDGRARFRWEGWRVEGILSGSVKQSSQPIARGKIDSSPNRSNCRGRAITAMDSHPHQGSNSLPQSARHTAFSWVRDL